MSRMTLAADCDGDIHQELYGCSLGDLGVFSQFFRADTMPCACSHTSLEGTILDGLTLHDKLPVTP